MAQRQFEQEILLDPNVLYLFYEYAHKQHCHEALHFFLAASEYADLPQPHRQRAEAALLAAYLVERAPEKINVSEPVLNRTMQRKGYGLSNIFQEATEACVDILIGDAWPYFKEEYQERLSKEKKAGSPKPSTVGLVKTNAKEIRKLFKPMRSDIARHAYFLFTGKHEEKIDAKKIHVEGFDAWLQSSSSKSNKAEILSTLIGLDPDRHFLRYLFDTYATQQDLLFETFKLLIQTEMNEIADNNEEHLLVKFRDDSASFIFFEEFFRYFASEWMKSFLEPRLRSFYSLNLDPKSESDKSKVLDLAVTFLDDLIESPPPSLALKPLLIWTEILMKKFNSEKSKEVLARGTARWFFSVITTATSFPNRWLEDRIRCPVSSRQFVAMIEDFLHCTYLPEKARRFTPPPSLLKKMREKSQDKIFPFLKDILAGKGPELKKLPKKSSKDTKSRINLMAHYAYSLRALLPQTLNMPDSLADFFNIDVSISGKDSSKEASKKKDENIQDTKGVRLVLLVGFSGVGRTAILNRMVDDSFGETFYSKDDEVSSVFNFSGIPVQIVNPALDEKTPFDDLPYLDRASGCLIVFDLTDHASFTDLVYWWEVAQKRYLPTVLLGNHLDECAKSREVPSAKAIKWAEEHGVKYFEVSAKTGEGLQRAMESLVEAITLFKK